jgi:hypothetical protein
MQFGFWDTGRQTTYEYDSWRFAQFAHIQIKTFPVLPSAYNESDCVPPPHHDAQLHHYGRYVYCDYTVDLKLLEHFIMEDLYNWMQLGRSQD